MTKTTFLVTTTKISLIHVLSALEKKSTNNSESLCSLRWKFGKLIVSREPHQEIHLEPLENLQWLTSCLNHSSTQAVCIDLELGYAVLQLWANACQKSQKSIFIRVPANPNSPQVLNSLKWKLKSFLDRLVAAILIILTSPFLIILILLILIEYPGPIFSLQWCVGQRGKLFQTIKFRTTSKKLEDNYEQNYEPLHRSQSSFANSRKSRLGHWMNKYNIDLLPQLFNVLRGEMSFVGSRAFNLHEVTQIDPIHRRCLRELPGMISFFHIQEPLNLLNATSDNHYESSHVVNWLLSKKR